MWPHYRSQLRNGHLKLKHNTGEKSLTVNVFNVKTSLQYHIFHTYKCLTEKYSNTRQGTRSVTFETWHVIHLKYFSYSDMYYA